MTIQTVFIYLFFSTFGISSCIPNPFAETKLPKEMPERTSFRYTSGGGMVPAWYRVEIRKNILSVEDKDAQKDLPDKWFAEITKDEKQAIYKVFYENKFDLIENEERKEIVYDAGSESVYIGAGKVSKNVSYGMNSPLSRRNAARWSAAAAAIKALASKYKGNGKPIVENYALISYRKSEHSMIFESGKYTGLDLVEIHNVQNIIKKAIGEYNSKQQEVGKITGLERYRYQIMAVEENDEKLVWINSMCSEKKDWKRRVAIVADGGTCYFNFYINLTKKTYDRFSVNGEA